MPVPAQPATKEKRGQVQLFCQKMNLTPFSPVAGFAARHDSLPIVPLGAARMRCVTSTLVREEGSMNQVIPDVALVDNSEQRTPLVLVLDCSGSMSGAPVEQLNEGLQILRQELQGDVVAAKRVRVLVVTYGGMDGAEVADAWRDAMDFDAPILSAGGTTPMGHAVELALDEIEAEKGRFRQAGIAYTRPWMFLMSDGAPTDDWEPVADRCRADEAANKVAVFPIAVGEADTGVLGRFSRNGDRAVKRLSGLQFRELFVWLSASMQVVSQSTPGGQAQLPSTDTWALAPL